MGEKTRVWTKQHENVLKVLEKDGRYTVKKEYIVAKMEEHAGIYLDVYDWYYRKASALIPPPADVRYPVWVSLSKEERIGKTDGNVNLELEIPTDQLITMDIDKWGLIVNYMYIPVDDADDDEHRRLLKTYGIDDVDAYMKPFYPNIKGQIIKSWDRLFDEGIHLSDMQVGTLWEVKAEWLVDIEK